MVRLVGGQVSFEGRVEVFWNNEWGSVCDDDFDQSDGDIICKYLGFPGAEAIYTGAHFGQGIGAIWFDNMACMGQEYSPYHCNKNTIGQHDCSHYEDAGVHCSSKSHTFTHVVMHTLSLFYDYYAN